MKYVSPLPAFRRVYYGIFPKNEAFIGLVMDHFGFDPSLIPEVVPVFSDAGQNIFRCCPGTWIKKGTPVTYRAGDQPNNAFSLNVLEPGEIAATAGTSGVVYGVSDRVSYDPQSRVNTFAHVNHSPSNNRLGVLLCINGTGILNSWIKRNVAPNGMTYEEMNRMAESVAPGSEGLVILPFGNGSERMLGNRETRLPDREFEFQYPYKAHIIMRQPRRDSVCLQIRYGYHEADRYKA
jgi:xylulokinase